MLSQPFWGRWVAGLTALFISGAAAQSPDALRERLQACAGCHGSDGNSQTTGVPSLAGQPKLFLENQLVLTREGLRGTEVLQKTGLLRGVADRDIVALAKHYASLPVRALAAKADPVLERRGRQAASKLRCNNCHLPDYSGREQIPRLAAQREEYLFASMRSFRDRPRRGGDTIMTAALYGVSDEDIRAMAHYLSRLQ
jgi:cytochrome c553